MVGIKGDRMTLAPKFKKKIAVKKRMGPIWVLNDTGFPYPSPA
jgi:hypothetical protein